MKIMNKEMLENSGRWKFVWRIYILGSICCTHNLFTVGLESHLLKSQGDHFKENSLQSSEYDIRLEDFFWTGSGDGPPSYRKSILDKNNVRDTIITTSTVVATVYINGNMDLETDPLCLHDCTESNNYPSGYLPSDRRYWLLTVLAGYFSQDDYPIIEDKLAKLYRMAFSRQQSWHLGISQSIFNNQTNIGKRSFSTMNISQFKQQIFQSVNDSTNDNINENATELNESASQHHINKRSASNTSIANKDAYKIVPSIRKRTVDKNVNNHRISVIVHNITSLSSNDGRLIDDVDGNSYVASNRNQTEIIYSVFVDRKPVIARTAADDMKLVTEDEVAEVMGKLVFIKAEPYLKEPQATPLVPATIENQNSNLIAVIGQNPTMLIVGIIMIILLVVLLVGLLLMTRAKRKRSAEVKRLTVGRSLISPTLSANHEDIEKIDSENGIENIAFVNDAESLGVKKTEANNAQHRKSNNPVLHFPHPPLSSPSSSTSDSSIFYPKRRSRLDVQNILDEKTITHFEAKNSGTPIYATVTKKKENRKKIKRKYLSENRVGSMDEQTNSSQSSTCSEVFNISEKDHNSYEREDQPPLHQYNKNKILQDNKFSTRSPDDELESPTEAFNKEILRALQRGRSGDSISIGSYLSMASVRSFPKCTVPESLSRVLEPVSMTHLDHSEIEGSDTGGIPRVVNAHYKLGKITNTTELNIEGQGSFSRSQSDGADPGVLNWELHKKMIENKEIMSPNRDPVLTRTRFEGLLEGAIKLYSNDEAQYESGSEINTINEVPGAIRPIENKSKSAMDMYRNRGVLSRSTSDHIKYNRPFTAIPSKTNNVNRTTPPSPYKKAWGSGAPSPLVRPLSAGPFHRPDPPSIDVVRVLAPHSSTVLSTAPLIEAIQNELKKFNK